MSFVVPKSYRPEGQPRSTSDEFPSRAVFGNSRQFQYGGLLPFTLRDQAVYNVPIKWKLQHPPPGQPPGHLNF